MLRVTLLGDFDMRLDEAPVTGVATPRLQALVAYLLLHRGVPLSRAHLAYLFWPDTTEAQARTNLRNLLHHLRHALPDCDSYVETTVQTLTWRAEAPLALDVDEWQAALAEAGSAPAAQARPALEKALALYHGDLLPSCYDDWILPHRERLRQSYLDALERLTTLLEEARDYRAAVSQAQTLLRADPLSEASYRRLIRLYSLSGDRAAALRVYHTCVTVLKRELDVEPSAATRGDYQRLLGAGELPSPVQPAQAAFTPLVGREAEWKTLLEAWRRVTAGSGPRVVLLSGEAGIGKSRLAEELLLWAGRQGISLASARCYAAEGELAFAPVTAWLRARPLPPLEDVWLTELARLLPELASARPNLPRPTPLTEAWQRQRLFEAASRAVLGGDPAHVERGGRQVLLIDDLQWCDTGTLEWLHFLLRKEPGARLLVVGTCRPEEVGEEHPLTATLRALRADGLLTEIELGPLDPAATRELAEGVAAREVSEVAARELYRQTEGNPLFVVEMVRSWAARGENGPGAAPTGLAPLPPRVMAVLLSRLGQLSPEAREVAEMAATIGREFGFPLLRVASQTEESTLVRLLDELWRRRIVREHGADGYDFSHDRLREAAYGGASQARRRWLHQQAARALEALYGSELDRYAAQLATHYERAGQPERAIPYHQRAAEAARQVYAQEEAIAHYLRALELLAVSPATLTLPEQARLREELADLLSLTGCREQARQEYARAVERTPSADAVTRARLQRKIGTAWDEENHWQEAESGYAAAEAALGDEQGQTDADWWREWLAIQHRKMSLYYGLVRLEEMAALAERCRPVVGRYGTAMQRGEYHRGLQMLGLRRENYAVSDQTVEEGRAAVDAFREAGDENALTLTISGLGFTLLWAGHLQEAEAPMLEGLERTERAGDVAVMSRVLTYLHVLYRRRGELERVRHYAERALKLATERGQDEYAGMANASLAWLAWKQGTAAEAESLAREAVTLWAKAPLSTPFEWTARLVLIGLAAERGDVEEGTAQARALLQPQQQRLPAELTAALEQAAGAVDGQRRVIELSQTLGYL